MAIRQLEHKKVKHEDWNLFQMCLTLMQTIGSIFIFLFLNKFDVILSIPIYTGDLLGQIQQFEKSLIIDITEANNKLQSTSGSVFNQYKKLLLHTSSQNELENLTASFQKGNQYKEFFIDDINYFIFK